MHVVQQEVDRMRVQLIASTTLHSLDATGWEDHVQTSPYADPDSDVLAEFAGRACYQSWSRPNPDTATNQAYLAHILEVDHSSVLEHASATFYVTGVSRSLTHELIRHRHLSFSQLSQRFVDESDAKMVMPPAVVHELTRGQLRAQAGWDGPALMSHFSSVWDEARDVYRVIVERLVARGLTRKQAREAARAVLPNATETKIVVTGNMRTWRYVIAKRIAPEADAEIQQFAREVLRQLKELAPATFQDM